MIIQTMTLPSNPRIELMELNLLKWNIYSIQFARVEPCVRSSDQRFHVVSVSAADTTSYVSALRLVH
jgi:hypothetical protein